MRRSNTLCIPRTSHAPVDAPPRRFRRLRTAGKVLLFVFIALFFVGRWDQARHGPMGYHPITDATASDIDKAMNWMRAYPLFGLVLSGNKEAEQKARAALEAYARSGDKAHDQRLARLGADIRSEYVVPVLARADDLSVLTVAARFSEFYSYLKLTDVQRCYKFFWGGPGNFLDLSNDAQALYKQAMAAMEAAYRNGMGSTRTYEPLKGERIGEVILNAGLTTEDITALQDYDKLSQAQGCAVIVKLYAAPMRLSVPDGGALARTILTFQ